MNILVNNEQVVTEVATLAALAQRLQLPEKGVAIAINNKVITRALWADTNLQENDSVTIIKAAFGG